MRIFFLVRILGVTLVTAGLAPTALGQTFLLTEDFRTGNNTSEVRESAAKLPEDRALYQLTPVQRDVIRSWYKGMSQADEPPYPLHGPAWLNSLLRSLAKSRQVTGELAMALSVNEFGVVTEANVLRTPNEAFRRHAMSLVRGVRFSPGLCGSLPCKLQYPVALVFN
jgi:hypothetical protein